MHKLALNASDLSHSLQLGGSVSSGGGFAGVVLAKHASGVSASCDPVRMTVVWS
jgi:hypothetical protein